MRSAPVALLLVFATGPLARAQSNLRELALSRLPLVQAISSDPVVMTALRAKNASGESFQDIRRKDAEWSQSPQAALRRELASNNCALRLRELTKNDPAVVEVILMDRNDASGCNSRETSDYWQGDEEKFQKSFQEDQNHRIGVFNISSPAFTGNFFHNKTFTGFIYSLDMPIRVAGGHEACSLSVQFDGGCHDREHGTAR